jgi:hypothetical protein
MPVESARCCGGEAHTLVGGLSRTSLRCRHGLTPRAPIRSEAPCKWSRIWGRGVGLSTCGSKVVHRCAALTAFTLSVVGLGRQNPAIVRCLACIYGCTNVCASRCERSPTPRPCIREPDLSSNLDHWSCEFAGVVVLRAAVEPMPEPSCRCWLAMDWCSTARSQCCLVVIPCRTLE